MNQQYFEESLNKIKKIFYQFAVKKDPHYSIDNNNKEAITKCLVWFLGGNELYKDICPKKGLIIIGAVGAGKSWLIEILQEICRLKPCYGFRIKKASEISDDFAMGITGEFYHSNPDNGTNKPFNLAIDDVGFERRKVMHFGNEIYPVAYILDKRYSLFEHLGIRTHITSNLTAEDFDDDSYGDRIRDRIRQMCNTIILLGNSRRK